MVYFLVLGRVNLIMYCRIGDTKWTTLEIPKGIVAGKDMASLIYFKGKLYVMCCNDHFQLVVERLPLRCCNCDCISLGIRRFEVSTDSFVFPYRGGYSCVGKTYFLESDEEIYMIEMVCLDKSRHLNYLVVSINVSRLDFSSMSWKEVNTLGDTVLFLGEDTNAFCSAAELGLSKGYLYYTLHKDQSLYMFDIEDKCTMTILPCSKLPTSWFSSQWIMMPQPTVSVSVDGRIMEDLSRKVRQEDYTIRAEEIKEIISQDDNENLRKKQKKENPDEPRPWMVINEDIVDSIASHLHPVDFLHFRAVCKANKLPIVKQISGAMRSTYLTPWLLFSTENASRYNFVDPMHNNEKYLMNLPELLAGAIVRCQRGGWLLMLKGRFTFFFYNPLTKETIQLPELQSGYCCAGITFSSLPTCSDCLVFGITQQNEEEISICIIKRGADRWEFDFFENSDLEKFMPTYNEPVFHKGSFYCVDSNGTLGVFNEDSWEVLKRPHGYSNAAYVSFLVECENEVLLVRILGFSVAILKLDSLEMVWQKVESLGKHMLFISFTSCLAAIAPKSCMENKVYFPRLHDERILYYSLETGSYHSVGSTHCAKDYFDTKSWTNCTWIEPNWSRSTSQELVWLNNKH
ncbi:uncharacterized protein LOC113313457 isoform X2 [Papaver somniferum]|uniref:uncharacterized protein LOC113313457 isoform X2 n=1 Tax=Papaver somniferum TaxID=3469 RepID=UPI000E6F4A20|nr:uncharacterized protein LOC113313457 isoform X2 [Papaver somniferum]XP_026418017.1 uncharacterized protein LOC113313457 isoform X2 [Papaver somniferum]XP_026418018.1 uncharacterized protein LOC113313457 isoform X2 [Papaver somniferum]